MKEIGYAVIAVACATLLAACGGGDQTSTTSASAGASRQQAAAVPEQTSNDVIWYVSGFATDKTNTGIDIKDAQGNRIALYKDEMLVQTLDNLPDGIANHEWALDSTKAKGHLRIRFMPGTYRFKNGWTWPATASGHDAARQIIVEQAPNTEGEVALLGSVKRSMAYEANAGRLTLNLGNIRPFEQLWVEEKIEADKPATRGIRTIRARYPDAGNYLYVQAGAKGWPAQDVGPAVVDTIDGRPVSLQAFQADETGYQALSSILADQDSKAIVVLMNNWQSSKLHVKAVDAANRRVRLNALLPDYKEWHLGQGTAQRYFLENRLSYLNSPGEWYGSGSTLNYIPWDPTRSTTVNFEVPQVEKLLSMSGSLASNKWLQHVTFSGIKFRYAKSDTPAEGYQDNQADAKLGAAIELNDARFVSFLNCEVSHTGAHAIWLNDHVQHVTIEGSELFDLGAGGVKIGKYRPAGADDNSDLQDLSNPAMTKANTVRASRIHSIGHVYPGATGVWIGRSSYNQVLGNLIKDTTYSGISVGWTWTNNQSMAHDNLIADNFLENIGQSALGDLGAIYLLGRAPNTRVQGNVIRGVHGYPYYGAPARGIYLDESSAEVSVVSNLVYDVDGEGLFLHYGERNLFHANTVAKVGQAFGMTRRLAGSTATPITFSYNSFYPTSNDMVTIAGLDELVMSTTSINDAVWLAPAPVFNGNSVSPQFLPAGTQLKIPQLCPGCATDNASTVTDAGSLKVPTVTNGQSYPVRQWLATELSAAESASRLWKDRNPVLPPKFIDFKAKQWPLSTDIKVFEFPVQMTVKQTAPALSIQDDASTTPPTRYLALTDAARAPIGTETSPRVWEPYTLTPLNYEKDTKATVSFRAKFDAKTKLMHAWRSDPSGNKTGPRLDFVSDGSVIQIKPNADASVATVPFGTWNTFEIKAGVGGKTWTLRINGQQVGGDFNVPNSTDATLRWDALKYMVMASLTNEETTTGFSEIKVENR